jgi:hypothetical protein
MKRSELKKICKPFITDNGGLLPEATEALLRAHNYTKIDADHRVEEMVNIVDSKHNEFVMSTADHLFYVSDDTIHDNVTDYNKAYFLNEMVETIYYRVKGEML